MEITAAAFTPDALQKHVRRSRFGIGPDNFKTLAEEFEALEKLGKPEESSPPTRTAPTSISELGPMP